MSFRLWQCGIGIAVLACTTGTAYAVGFDRDDFIVSSGFNAGFAVYDRDFTYKGELGDLPFSGGFGMDFDHDGRLVVRGILSDTRVRQITVVEPDGSLATNQPEFVTSPPGGLDLKVAPNGNYLIAGQDASFGEPNGLLEIEPDGTVVRQFGGGDYEGVAVLPDGTVLGGGGSFAGFLRAFDPATGDEVYSLEEFTGPRAQTGPFFDEGQRGANSMTYSHTTNTVLMADRLSGRIYERNVDGSFVRAFDLPEDANFVPIFSLMGVTRGPGGDVFAVIDRQIVRWSAYGDWIETIDAPDLGTVYSWNIVWAGNAPGLTFLEGDYDGDGLVSQGDLNLVLLHWGDGVVPDGWVAPDVFDGSMSQNELNAVLLNWGNDVAAGPPTVPEPAAAPAAALGLVAALTWRRQRSH
ncbi:MAG: hypothetical protein AAF333_04045 [Planctomycetota bacterium]